MSPHRQIRISVNGTYQFTVAVGLDIPLELAAERAHEAMQLSDNLVAHVSTGQINFVPRPS